jgi:hypothetical protein
MIKMLVKLLERHVLSSCVCLLLLSSSCFSWLLFMLCVRDLEVVRQGSYASGCYLVSSLLGGECVGIQVDARTGCKRRHVEGANLKHGPKLSARGTSKYSEMTSLRRNSRAAMSAKIMPSLRSMEGEGR